MVGRGLGHVPAPGGGSRPPLGLLADAAPGTRPIQALLTGAAVRSGLLTLLGEHGPLPERAAAVPQPVCLALGGHDGVWPGATVGPGEVPEVPLPPSTAREARRQAAGLVS